MVMGYWSVNWVKKPIGGLCCHDNKFSGFINGEEFD
jgi:hypothetical protein